MSTLLETHAAGRPSVPVAPDERTEPFASRARDWRTGATVYQVFVDRFARPHDLDAKRDRYAAPRTLVDDWGRAPKRGTRNPEIGCNTAELEFWGGDLASLRDRLDHIASLGAEVLYLNPIFEALTNHKYDATDYFAISPEFGTSADLTALADDLHARDMKLVLDGVFNHTGRTHPRFVEAMANPESPWREHYVIDAAHPNGYRSWFNVPNLPELNLEHPPVREELWEGAESVVRRWLERGADGWRLDVAYDLGFEHLRAISDAAHETKPGSLVVGEIWSYPDRWMRAMDGVLNFHAQAILYTYVKGGMSGQHASALLQTMVDDAGLDAVLRSWLILDNHDTPRVGHVLPDQEVRRLAQVLQFTLPGAPLLYYGVELGVHGGPDPGNRSTMPWHLLEDEDEAALDELTWMRSLVELRSAHPALRFGEFQTLHAEHVLAFQRTTDRRSELMVVVANPSGRTVHDVVQVRDPRQMSYTPMVCAISGDEARLESGLMHLSVPPRSARVFSATEIEAGRYSPYKRQGA